MKRSVSVIWITVAISVSCLAQKSDMVFKKPSAQWAQIPSGTLVVADEDSSWRYQGKTRLRNMDSVVIKGFWMSKTEISNVEYREFLRDIIRSGDQEKMKIALPDTLVWRYKLSYNEPYVTYYFRHPAYGHYPVVGITYEAAQLYCRWLTEKYNARLKELLPKLNAKRIEFRLPTLEEWMWAAKGGHEYSPYPWGGPYLRNAKGDYLANFMTISESGITYDRETGKPQIKYYYAGIQGVAGNLSDGADLTAPVMSYWANDYGLYNMAGNVAEMISEKGIAKGGSWFTCGFDLQIEAPDPFAGDAAPKSFVGFRPVFVVIE